MGPFRMSLSATTRFPILDECPKADRGTSATVGHRPSDGEPADEVLMSDVFGGNKTALAALFRRYARLVRAVAYRILRDAAEADDLLQEVFLFIQRKCDTFDATKSSARSWIVHLAYERAIDRRRYLNTRHFYTTVEFDDAVAELPDPRFQVATRDAALDAALAKDELQKALAARLAAVRRRHLADCSFGRLCIPDRPTPRDRSREQRRNTTGAGTAAPGTAVKRCRPRARNLAGRERAARETRTGFKNRKCYYLGSGVSIFFSNLEESKCPKTIFETSSRHWLRLLLQWCGLRLCVRRRNLYMREKRRWYCSSECGNDG
jgi:RNA polymerase sigma factor (sigma-70 family)